ncbi:hypothetical protein PISMIDRAFT_196752 [Pisolithus microcarpus 441]|uniref:Uncharacterized protein n=1 Tax=Pisolithus microcarpus 441 TaxID=765257 RepID=A0A0C9ZDY6_9AGAM|nr:hypothetical protein PISMIDRAFT_196752 [Pisolithus microcarpus 441]
MHKQVVLWISNGLSEDIKLTAPCIGDESWRLEFAASDQDTAAMIPLSGLFHPHSSLLFAVQRGGYPRPMELHSDLRLLSAIANPTTQTIRGDISPGSSSASLRMYPFDRRCLDPLLHPQSLSCRFFFSTCLGPSRRENMNMPSTLSRIKS